MCCLAGLDRGLPPSLARSAGAQPGLIRFKRMFGMFGELAFKRTNVLRIDVSLCDSSRDSGGVLERRIAG